jgi:signal transduction histidine kinase
MNRDTALKMLCSNSSQERLEGSRYLARNSEASDLPTLKRARQTETVSYVKRSLDTAIARSTNVQTQALSDTINDIDIPDDVRKNIRTREIERISGFILHEIASPLGLVRDSAAQELPDFVNSKTKVHLDRLSRIFDCVTLLKTAATTPKSEEFDLSQLVNEIIEEETENKHINVSTQGPRPFLIVSDPRLLRLALCNGLRNAIEATVQSGVTSDHSIVIAWDKTDVDYWLTIIDKGPGISGSHEKAFEIGQTNKKDHAGFGLAIARQAIESLYGSASLHAAEGGGTRFELRWDAL